MQLLYHIECIVCLCSFFGKVIVFVSSNKNKVIKMILKIIIKKEDILTENGKKIVSKIKVKKMLQTSGAAVRHHNATIPYFKIDHNSAYISFDCLLFSQAKKYQIEIEKTTTKKAIRFVYFLLVNFVFVSILNTVIIFYFIAAWSFYFRPRRRSHIFKLTK